MYIILNMLCMKYVFSVHMAAFLVSDSLLWNVIQISVYETFTFKGCVLKYSEREFWIWSGLITGLVTIHCSTFVNVACKILSVASLDWCVVQTSFYPSWLIWSSRRGYFRQVIMVRLCVIGWQIDVL